MSTRREMIAGTALTALAARLGPRVAKALTDAGKPVEYWEIKKAGHSPASPAADRELLARCIGFLEKALA